jgi:DHA1 family inner membrane transport protein
MIVGAPVMALATLRLPRRATLVLALLVFAAGHVAAALSDSFTIVLIARVVTALATGAFWSVAAVVATDAAGPARSSRALGIMMSGVGLATVAGVPLGSFAGQLVGWRGTFWGIAALSIVAAVTIRMLAPADADREAVRSGAAIRALMTVRTWLLVAATVLITGAYMGTFSFISPLLTNRSGFAEAAVPIILICFGVGAIIGTNLSGRFADRRPIATYLVAAIGVIVVLAAFIPLSINPVATVVLIVLLGVTGMAVPPVATGLAVHYAPAGATLAAALAVAAFNGGTAIATWLGGPLLDTPVGETGPALLGGVMAAVGLVPLIVLATMRSAQGRRAIVGDDAHAPVTAHSS